MPDKPRRRAGVRPRTGAAGRLRFRLTWKRALLGVVALIGIFVLTIGGLVAYAAMTLPDINNIGQATGSIRILDRNGNLIASVGHLHNQQEVPINEIAPIMQNAMLAAEDRNFYHEGAFDFPRVVKAVIDDIILRRAAEGASTITQQLVKQAFFVDPSKSPLRKIREALLAQEIDGKWSKQEILDQYLNITYFGENAFGIENAAERFFGKHASQLTLPEAALLAGLPQAPSAYDPYDNPQGAFTRMSYVLQGLVSMGVVTQAQANAVDPLSGDAATQQAHQAAIEADLKNGQANATVGPAPHFAQYIEDELQSSFADDPAFLNGNLTVTTTLDLSLQEKADQIVASGVAAIGHNANNGALLMLDPRNGDILAMVGSADYTNASIDGEYNIVQSTELQPGSSFKPFVYETGFMNGTLTPSTVLQDTRAESEKLGGVQDFDRLYQGNITAAHALLGSRNIATEQAMEIAGIQNVIDFAHTAGITTPIAPNASSAIGTSATSMMDLATGFAAFANGGTRITPRGILKVVDGNGNVLVDNTAPAGGQQIMTPAQAWSITNILRNYPHFWGLRIKWPTAGKSGTTDNFLDAWYTAYTPDWVISTWVGHTGNGVLSPMDEVFGTTEAQYIAVPFINSLPKPSPFVPVNGALNDCSAQDASAVPQTNCPTPTPSPSASPSATPVPTPTSSTTPTAGPTPSLCPVVVSPSPSPGPGNNPCATPSPSPATSNGAAPPTPP